MFKSRAGRTGQNGYWLSLSLKWLWWDAVPNGCSFDGSSFKEGCSRDLTALPVKITADSWGWPLLPFVPWWSGYLVLIWGPLGSRWCLVVLIWLGNRVRLMSVAIWGLPVPGEAWRAGLVDSQNLGLTWEAIPWGWKNWRFCMVFFFLRLIPSSSPFFPFPLPLFPPLLPTSSSSSPLLPFLLSLFLNVSY